MEIKINNLTYIKEKKKILNNINHTFDEGITAIMGYSCGKSTILKLINYLGKPTKGQIYINNIKLTKGININKIRPKIGYLPQEKETSFFNRTVYEEVSFGLKHFKIKDNHQKKVSEALKLVGLNDNYINMNPFNLSYGEKTKLALACLLVTNPDIILLDEPTLGLDNQSKKNLINLLNELKANKTIIINTNDIEFISKITNNILVMDKGNIIYQGTLKDLDKNNIDNLALPAELEFIKYVNQTKNIKLNYHNNINKLSKEIKNHVKK